MFRKGLSEGKAIYAAASARPALQQQADYTRQVKEQKDSVRGGSPFDIIAERRGARLQAKVQEINTTPVLTEKNKALRASTYRPIDVNNPPVYPTSPVTVAGFMGTPEEYKRYRQTSGTMTEQERRESFLFDIQARQGLPSVFAPVPYEHIKSVKFQRQETAPAPLSTTQQVLKTLTTPVSLGRYDELAQAGTEKTYKENQERAAALMRTSSPWLRTVGKFEKAGSTFFARDFAPSFYSTIKTPSTWILAAGTGAAVKGIGFGAKASLTALGLQKTIPFFSKLGTAGLFSVYAGYEGGRLINREITPGQLAGESAAFGLAYKATQPVVNLGFKAAGNLARFGVKSSGTLAKSFARSRLIQSKAATVGGRSAKARAGKFSKAELRQQSRTGITKSLAVKLDRQAKAQGVIFDYARNRQVIRGPMTWSMSNNKNLGEVYQKAQVVFAQNKKFRLRSDSIVKLAQPGTALGVTRKPLKVPKMTTFIEAGLTSPNLKQKELISAIKGVKIRPNANLNILNLRKERLNLIKDLSTGFKTVKSGKSSLLQVTKTTSKLNPNILKPNIKNQIFGGDVKFKGSRWNLPYQYFGDQKANDVILSGFNSEIPPAPKNLYNFANLPGKTNFLGITINPPKIDIGDFSSNVLNPVFKPIVKPKVGQIPNTGQGERTHLFPLFGFNEENKPGERLRGLYDVNFMPLPGSDLFQNVKPITEQVTEIKPQEIQISDLIGEQTTGDGEQGTQGGGIGGGGGGGNGGGDDFRDDWRQGGGDGGEDEPPEEPKPLILPTLDLPRPRFPGDDFYTSRFFRQLRKFSPSITGEIFGLRGGRFSDVKLLTGFELRTR